MKVVALERKLKKLLTIVFLFISMIFFSCSEDNNGLWFETDHTRIHLPDSMMYKESLGIYDSLVKAELREYISDHLIRNGKIKGIPMVELKDSLVVISSLANKSMLYICIPSYYIKMDTIPVLIYKKKEGYIELDSTIEYSKPFLKNIEPFINDDLKVFIHPENKFEIDGKEYKSKTMIFVNPKSNYHPENKYLKIEDGYLAEITDSSLMDSVYFNCHFFDTENRYEVINKHK